MSASPVNPVPHLRAITTLIEPESSLLEYVSGPSPLVFQRLGNGLVGREPLVVARFSGANRFTDASQWWEQVVSVATVDNPLTAAGSGLIAFGSFSFDADSSSDSVLIIPKTVISRQGDTWWTTTVSLAEGDTPDDPATEPFRPVTQAVDWREGSHSAEGFVESVERAIREIGDGRVAKVVLARDLVAEVPAEPHWPALLTALATDYPDTYVFAIDGLFGASPETLASARDHQVTLQVLAGSAKRGSTPEEDQIQQSHLATSHKDLDEHRFAVESVVRSLLSHGINAVADEVPSTVKLHNLWHLGTRVVAGVPEGWSSLHVVNALHPTAAVAGTPTVEALELIAKLEPFDRGRYAGPVGWLDDRGNGDWAIALRCAQYSPKNRSITAFAGAGIVADSMPQQELLETNLKFQPILDALNRSVEADKTVASQ